MSKKRLLTFLVGTFAALGLVATATPFVQSLGPSAKAKAAHELHIPRSEIPKGAFKEVIWGRSKIFVGQFEDLRAFSIYYGNNRYWLPDPTWERPAIPCGEFKFSEDVFQCTDHNFDDHARKQYRWDSHGASLDPFFPALMKPAYVAKSDEIVFGAEQ